MPPINGLPDFDSMNDEQLAMFAKNASPDELKRITGLLTGNPISGITGNAITQPQITDAPSSPWENQGEIRMPRPSEVNILPNQIGPYKPNLNMRDIFKTGGMIATTGPAIASGGGVVGAGVAGSIGNTIGGLAADTLDYLGQGYQSKGDVAENAVEGLIAGAFPMKLPAGGRTTPFPPTGGMLDIEDPMVQRALAAAGDIKQDGMPILKKPASEISTVGPNELQAIRAAEYEARSPSSIAKVIGVPTSKTPREMEVLKTIQQGTDDLYETKLFQHGGKIDPYDPTPGPVVRFKADGPLDDNIASHVQRVAQAKADINQAKADIAKDLDAALQEMVDARQPSKIDMGPGISVPRRKASRDVAFQSATPEESFITPEGVEVMRARGAVEPPTSGGVVTGATVDPMAPRGMLMEDIAPSLQKLEETIARLERSATTAPMGSSVRTQLEDIVYDFRNTMAQQLKAPQRFSVAGQTASPGGTITAIPEAEIMPSEAVNMIRNYNEKLRALKAYTELNRAAAANEGATTVAEARNAIVALEDIKHAMQDSLADVSERIITAAKNGQGLTQASTKAASYDPTIFKRLDRTYKVLSPYQREMAAFDNMTSAAKTGAPPRGLESTIGTTAEKTKAVPLTATSALNRGVGSLIEKGIEIVQDKPPPGLVALKDLIQRDTAPLEQLRRFAEMRNVSVWSPLTRNFNSLAKDQKGMADLGMLATQIGLLAAPAAIFSLPLPQRQELHKQLIQMMPQAFATPVSGYTSEVDGKITDPMEQAYHMKQGLEVGNLRTEMEVVSNLWKGGQYVPVAPQRQTMAQPTQSPTPSPDLAYSAMLEPNSDGVYDIPAPVSGESDHQRMIQQMKAATAWNSDY